VSRDEQKKFKIILSFFVQTSGITTAQRRCICWILGVMITVFFLAMILGVFIALFSS